MTTRSKFDATELIKTGGGLEVSTMTSPLVAVCVIRVAGTLERNSELISLTPMVGVLTVGAISGFGAPVTRDAATTAAGATDELANIGAPFALILIGISLTDVDRRVSPRLPVAEAVEMVAMAALEASMLVESPNEA